MGDTIDKRLQSAYRFVSRLGEFGATERGTELDQGVEHFFYPPPPCLSASASYGGTVTRGLRSSSRCGRVEEQKKTRLHNALRAKGPARRAHSERRFGLTWGPKVNKRRPRDDVSRAAKFRVHDPQSGPSCTAVESNDAANPRWPL